MSSAEFDLMNATFDRLLRTLPLPKPAKCIKCDYGERAANSCWCVDCERKIMAPKPCPACSEEFIPRSPYVADMCGSCRADDQLAHDAASAFDSYLGVK